MVTNNALNLNGTGIAKYDGAGTFSATTVTQHQLILGGASNALAGIALTDGQIAIGSTGIAPIPATLTGGTGIGITNAAGSVTISASGGGLKWTAVTGLTQAAAVNNGYIANNAGTVVVTLPAVSAVGDVVAVTGINNATGWQIAQNAGNTVFLGSVSTTPGVGGTITSTATRDTLHLVCVTANADWNVISCVGNLTVV